MAKNIAENLKFNITVADQKHLFVNFISKTKQLHRRTSDLKTIILK